MSEDNKVKVAIVGSGNIGTDLLYKLLEEPGHMELAMVAGIVPESEGLKRARDEGIEATAEGIQPVLDDPEIKIVFEATSAKAHMENGPMYKEAGKIAIDLTPAALGPYVVPTANLTEHLDEDNV
ncbi:MAG: acetaldehyde dehydrogenase (acetylating), partial [Actinomycetota bacterium]|nr:acetaldehyde dehydrogenase (acetylating) [Actinomycetota bacterium]